MISLSKINPVIILPAFPGFPPPTPCFCGHQRLQRRSKSRIERIPSICFVRNRENYSIHLGSHLNLLRNGRKLTETVIHWFDALTRGIFFNTRWTKFVSPCDHVISSVLKNATVRILSPSQPFLGSSRNAPLPKRLLPFESHCWRGVLRDDRPWKRLLAHPIPQGLAALFFLS